MNKIVFKYLPITFLALFMFGAGYLYSLNKNKSLSFKDEIFDALHYAYILKSINNGDYMKAQESINSVINNAVIMTMDNEHGLSETEYNAAFSLIKYVTDLDVQVDEELNEKLKIWTMCKSKT